MRRHLKFEICVPVGDEVSAARALWGAMRAEERSVVARLAAEWALLHEAGSDHRVILAPAEYLQQAGLPVAPPPK